jgi:putative addiction module killer protein
MHSMHPATCKYNLLGSPPPYQQWLCVVLLRQFASNLLFGPYVCIDKWCTIMHYLGMRPKRTAEYIEWYESQRPKEKAQIAKRLANIEKHEHFGMIKDLGNFLSELKWANGRRIYYSIMEDENGDLTLLILGGNKNGQNSDIKKARKLLEKHSKG